MELRPYPLHRRWIAVHKNNFARRNFPGVFDQRFARRMCAELELFDVAADALERFAMIKSDLAARPRLP